MVLSVFFLFLDFLGFLLDILDVTILGLFLSFFGVSVEGGC